MSAIQKLADWVEILNAEPPDTRVVLCPSEVLRLCFDLQAAQAELCNLHAELQSAACTSC